MASWREFEQAAPALAAVAARLWPGITALDRGEPNPEDGPCFRIAYLATVRPDGGPRLHPFCPILAGGRLYAAIPLASPKGHDLRHDARCVVHALPGPDDDELCIRALAREVQDDETRATVMEIVRRSGVGGMLVSVTRDRLFELDLERVDVARWLEVGQPGTWAERASWSA